MAYLQRISIGLLTLVTFQAGTQVPLTEKSYRESGMTKGVAILEVNWGRYWKCGQYENAQLQYMAFRQISDTNTLSVKEWKLAPASTLLAKPKFEPYVVLLDPGEYALSGFKFKVAASISDVRIMDVDSSKLIVDGKAIGGSFTVVAGQLVYVGHFGIDCNGEPTLWRFYIEGTQEFSQYVDNFHKQYPFTTDVPIIFKLFQTDNLGQAYELSK